MRDQMEKVVGGSASPEFIEMIKELVMQCDVKDQGGVAGGDGGEALLLGVDRVIAYHSGSRYNVEVDLLLPRLATVEVSHAIGLRVQQRIEELPDVERANIHVWMDALMDGWMDALMDGWIDG